MKLLWLTQLHHTFLNKQAFVSKECYGVSGDKHETMKQLEKRNRRMIFATRRS